ncbi:PTS system, mannose/fructose/sorbose family, IIA component [Enterococcus phoeniculicola]|jgi:PTS system mannose-specific IIA component|uniref:PTS system, mannose/fructose/sorbose family, IIA component n=1 Tax=Enterococcus phoeniculicola ATCC BAA-412 TaxID=1158610 RepID=R3WBG7_9ENTE|nr:PTS sugar transporter subunit IIA [Enterococcus phoeniculicola]EOL45271.1 PTS system, mannose/fructose/sorbose family, IIA component [Enterococcus phoeniculicola ATCC BAA-412]EOT74633.1 hypothetical protein I589_02233 [Enterococcus phoeniculicola ATCC BAA-412]OJG70904.1 PTS system, mannose/fructose/sorbose family, IIA component [Enterococcus phoeniculicola]
MGEFAVLLISHGYYAKEALESAEMIVGKQQNTQVVSVTPEKDLQTVLDEVNMNYEQLDTSSGLLILADILGGTPSNVAGNLVLSKKNVHAVTGFNLPMLLELFLNRENSMETVIEKIHKVYKTSFNDLNRVLTKEEEVNEY